jgi:voltage-gated potassium channel
MTKPRTYQEKFYQLLEAPANHNLARKLVVYFLFIMISANILVVFLETVQPVYQEYETILLIFTYVSIGIFTIEYFLRLWVCTLRPEYESPIQGRVRYAITPLAIFDLLAILPFYIPLLLPFDLRVLRIFRLTRVFTVLKLGRFSNAWETFAYVLRTKKEELIISGIIIFMVLTISSTAMYFIEHSVQPEKFSSIFDAMWWGVVTLSTVGYGDVYPITPLGKLVGAVVALSGIALFALPAGIIVAGLVECVHVRNYSHEASEKASCITDMKGPG